MKEINDLSYYPPDSYIIGYCCECGMEIYLDEPHYKIDGELIHTDCIRDFGENYFKDFRVI